VKSKKGIVQRYMDKINDILFNKLECFTDNTSLLLSIRTKIEESNYISGEQITTVDNIYDAIKEK
jgi:hypothetical protein